MVNALTTFAVGCTLTASAWCVYTALHTSAWPAAQIHTLPKALQRARLAGFAVIALSLIGTLAAVATEL